MQMLLSDLIILEKKKAKDDSGTYVSGKFSEESCDELYDLVKELKIPNPVPKESFHVTIVYSPKTVKYKGLGELENPWIVIPKNLHIFHTQDGKNCLVMKLHAPELIEQHQMIVDDYGAEHTFDEYIPHVTCSYDVGEDYKIPKKKIKKIELEIVEEISEPINKDYVKNLKD